LKECLKMSKYLIIYKNQIVLSKAIEITEKHLETYATSGLRTLLLTKKVIDPSTFLAWSQKYHVD